jgi:protein-L-isoaspartate(D-aspartate) O-methyltransferase
MTDRRADGMASMLADIRAETAATQWTTGVSELAPRVMAAMARVPREFFVGEPGACAYANRPLPIGHGQTISQPFIVALMTHLLAPRGHQRILEIGTGSGYQTAVLAGLCRKVYSIEAVAALAAVARERLRRLGCVNVATRTGNGCRGWPEEAPFDGIIVTAAAAAIPAALLEQLASGGRLVIPVGGPGLPQVLQLVRKDDTGRITVDDVLGVVFVPLVDGEPAAPPPDPRRLGEP